jgi:hypothetical protein
MSTSRVVGIGFALVLGSSALAQDEAKCTERTTIVDLETPVTGEKVFFYEIRGYAVEFRPEAVVDFWSAGQYADPALAEILSKELPLRDDTDLELFWGRLSTNAYSRSWSPTYWSQDVPQYAIRKGACCRSSN